MNEISRPKIRVGKSGEAAGNPSVRRFDFHRRFTLFDLLAAMAVLAGGVLAPVQSQTPGAIASFQMRFREEQLWTPAVVQPDGAILVTRRIPGNQAPLALVLARLTRGGGYDPDFSPPPVACWLDNLAGGNPILGLQPGGKILVTMRGGFLRLPGGETPRVIRLNPDGSLDETFRRESPGIIYDGSPFLSAGFLNVLPDGSFLTPTIDGVLKRIGADGRSDPRFSLPLPDGTGPTGLRIEDLLGQPDGKLVVAYYTRTSDPKPLVRLEPDGSVDPTFRAPSEMEYTQLSNIQVQLAKDGGFLVAGWLKSPEGVWSQRLLRLNHEGSLDRSFHAYAEAEGAVRIDSWAVLPDGKLLIGRAALPGEPGDARLPWVERLNRDGSADSTFRVQMPGPRSEAEFSDGFVRLLPEPDGSVLVTVQYDYDKEQQTLRLHGDGLPYLWPHTLRRAPEGGIEFQITAATNRPVVVEGTSSFGSGVWSPVTNFPAAIERGTMTVTDPDAGRFPQRIYRAVAR